MTTNSSIKVKPFRLRMYVLHGTVFVNYNYNPVPGVMQPFWTSDIVSISVAGMKIKQLLNSDGATHRLLGLI
ncbi:hypothetical protein ES703_86463 [subsurface metagenome]